jgi:hypothetical protein
LEYTNYDKYHSEPVEGFILVGPVSDRESIENLMVQFPDDDFAASIKFAEQMVAEGRKDDCMPRSQVPSILRATPISAYRLLSLGTKG